MENIWIKIDKFDHGKANYTTKLENKWQAGRKHYSIQHKMKFNKYLKNKESIWTVKSHMRRVSQYTHEKITFNYLQWGKWKLKEWETIFTYQTVVKFSL